MADDEKLTDREIADRMDRGLRRLVNMPPQHRKATKPKKKRAARKSRARNSKSPS